MRKAIALSLGVMLAAACGGSKGGKDGETAAEAEVDISAIDQLKGLSTELQVGVDEMMQPITDSEAVVDQITSLPDRLDLDAQALMAMASATLENGTVEISTDLDLTAEARAEVEAVLTKLQAIVDGLKATPERAKALTAKAATAMAQVPVLATKVTTSAQAKLANPLGSAESKAQAQADIEAVAQIKGDVETQIADVQNKIAGIPAMATEALAKLTASFAGSAGT